ncbi:MAG: hypothetical protein RLZZ511_3634 [Cyanobacteriota bacterium]
MEWVEFAVGGILSTEGFEGFVFWGGGEGEVAGVAAEFLIVDDAEDLVFEGFFFGIGEVGFEVSAGYVSDFGRLIFTKGGAHFGGGVTTLAGMGFVNDDGEALIVEGLDFLDDEGKFLDGGDDDFFAVFKGLA